MDFGTVSGQFGSISGQSGPISGHFGSISGQFRTKMVHFFQKNKTTDIDVFRCGDHDYDCFSFQLLFLRILQAET